VAKSRHPFTWRVAPVFAEQGFDVIARLQTYEHPDYGINRLNTDESAFIGEVVFRRARKDIARKIGERQSGKSYSSDSALDDPADQAGKDISDVYQWEKDIVEGPFWFSYCDGVFEFTRTVECEDTIHARVDYLFRDYAHAFLKTLGPIMALQGDTGPSQRE
jgi:hypothetical protein